LEVLINATPLLTELDALSHDGRMRRMVALGSVSQRDPAVRDALAQLARGTSYQRLLAVQACHGSRDGAYVLRRVSDPSRAVRSLALGALAIICDDDQVLQALSLVKMRAQLKLIDALAKRKKLYEY